MEREVLMMHSQDDYLLETLKVLGDESRLRLLRLVAEREHSVGELAEKLGLGEPTISHHLARLREVYLVNIRTAGTARYYRLNDGMLQRFKELFATVEKMPVEGGMQMDDKEWIGALGWSAEDQQVLRDYTIGAKLKQLPSKRKKTMVILRWLATLFEAGRLYTEAEVNQVIKGVYEKDYVSLRRDLIDMGYLHREPGGGKYWLGEGR
jgi:biotin operon repressor